VQHISSASVWAFLSVWNESLKLLLPHSTWTFSHSFFHLGSAFYGLFSLSRFTIHSFSRVEIWTLHHCIARTILYV
jgi:hypothetical protein